MSLASGLTTMVVALSRGKYRDRSYLFETIDDLSIVGLWHRFWKTAYNELNSIIDSKTIQ
jgi:hypothetical protein